MVSANSAECYQIRFMTLKPALNLGRFSKARVVFDKQMNFVPLSIMRAIYIFSRAFSNCTPLPCALQIYRKLMLRNVYCDHLSS